jgi:agmatine deiminase
MATDEEMSTPRADGYALPPEWAPHERTLMAWPGRPQLWRDRIGDARREYAACANAIAAFEPVTMVCADAAAAAGARSALSAEVEIIRLPLDDAWLRDSGPLFVLDRDGHRAGVHFRFNAWGGKSPDWHRDEAAGAVLADRHAERRYDAPFVLEGGSIGVDGAGTLVTTEQCLLNPNRNPRLSRAQIESLLGEFLGVERVVWLGRGLTPDRGTDGHVDLIAAFAGPGELLLQAAPPGDPNVEPMLDNRARAEAAGLEVTEMPVLPVVELDGDQVRCAHLNLYVCNGAVVVPVAGLASDAEALSLIQAAFPGREVVAVEATTLASVGGGPHCITQQVPSAVPSR